MILAEGAPVETHLNTNGREHFTNFVEYERLYGRRRARRSRMRQYMVIPMLALTSRRFCA